MGGVGDLPATFTTAQAQAAGVHPRDLYRARDDGLVVALSRGVFRQAGAPEASHLDLLAVIRRAPSAVVCLLSAAAVYDLTDELPLAVQIAVARGSWRPQITYPPVEVFQFDAGTFEVGLSSVDGAEGEPVRVYSPARTVVDLMRLRHRIGEPIALIALRRYVSSPGAKVGQLVELARVLDVLGPVRSAVDVLMAS